MIFTRLSKLISTSLRIIKPNSTYVGKPIFSGTDEVFSIDWSNDGYSNLSGFRPSDDVGIYTLSSNELALISGCELRFCLQVGRLIGEFLQIFYPLIRFHLSRRRWCII